jgi:hypothetical protein
VRCPDNLGNVQGHACCCGRPATLAERRPLPALSPAPATECQPAPPCDWRGGHLPILSRTVATMRAPVSTMRSSGSLHAHAGPDKDHQGPPPPAPAQEQHSRRPAWQPLLVVPLLPPLRGAYHFRQHRQLITASRLPLVSRLPAVNVTIIDRPNSASPCLAMPHQHTRPLDPLTASAGCRTQNPLASWPRPL